MKLGRVVMGAMKARDAEKKSVSPFTAISDAMMGRAPTPKPVEHPKTAPQKFVDRSKDPEFMDALAKSKADQEAYFAAQKKKGK